MSRINFLLLVISFSAIICMSSLSSCDNSNIKLQYKAPCTNETSRQIRFNTLVNNIGKYDSQAVEVEGVYKGKFEQSALFKNAWSSDIAEALWISFNDSLKEENSGEYLFSTEETSEKINGKKIRIRGIVDSKSKGHLDKFRGEIRDVCFIEILN